MHPLVSIVFAVAALAVIPASALKVTVYYESLCPDSIRFITQQLTPTYAKLSFDVEFVPYGKAAHRTNPWNIRCQHGANECLGNAVQGCLLERVLPNADQVALVNCIMSTSYPPLYGKTCADKLRANYTGVSDCSTGDEGRAILAKHGDQTHSLTPGLSFVPTIVINDVFNQQTQDEALVDLPSAICKADSTVVGCNSIRRNFSSGKRG